MSVAVTIKIVASLSGRDQAVTLAVSQGGVASFPVLAMPPALDHIAAGVGDYAAATGDQAGCLAVAQAVVNDHFPHGYAIMSTPDWQGHVLKNERWEPSGGGDFGFAFPITQNVAGGTARLHEDMQVTDTGGNARFLRGQFYLVVQKK